MEYPTKEQISAVISEMITEECDDKKNFHSERCNFLTHLDKLSPDIDHMSDLDKLICSGLNHSLGPLMFAIPAENMSMLHRMAWTCFVAGYKTHMQQEIAEALKKAFSE